MIPDDIRYINDITTLSLYNKNDKLFFWENQFLIKHEQNESEENVYLCICVFLCQLN